jgi:hypothetical protein
MMMLQPLLDALRAANWHQAADRLEPLLLAVEKARPDLRERSLFAARAKNSMQLERIFLEAMDEAQRLHEMGAPGTEGGIPYIHNLRFNHSTGRLHIGHGSHYADLFDKD